MSNLSILDQNIIHALDDSEGEAMYLRLRDRMSSLRAEGPAYGWRYVSNFISPMLAFAAEPFAEPERTVPEVHAFIRERFFNMVRAA